MLPNKENRKNDQGNTGISFARNDSEYKTPPPSKNQKRKNDIRKQVEDIQHAREFEKLWGNL